MDVAGGDCGAAEGDGLRDPPVQPPQLDAMHQHECGGFALGLLVVADEVDASRPSAPRWKPS